MTARLRTRSALTAALAALITAACDDPSQGGFSPDDVAPRDGAGQGGPIFNTNVILTSSVPAVDTTGLALDGVTLVSVEVLSGASYYTIDPGTLTVDQGTLVGYRGSLMYTRNDFVNSHWTFQVDGQTLEAELTTVETADDAGLYDPLSTSVIRNLDPDRLVYTFHYENDSEQQITTCTEDAVGGARMVLYGDLVVDHATGDVSERANTIYFGCLSGVIGKVALWGYAPDSPSLTSITLPEFETAARMARADYCANGTSYTTEGKQLTIKDRWDINTHGLFPSTEAVWTTGGGAKCLRRIRSSGKTLLGDFTCPGGKVIPHCGNDEALIENRWNIGYGNLWTKIPL